MDSTSNEDLAVETSSEMVNGTVDSGVATDNNSNNDNTSMPPPPPPPPPMFQSEQSMPYKDSTPPEPEPQSEPEVAADDANADDNENQSDDIRYKLMQIYKPKDSGPVDVTAPLPELNHSTPPTPSTVYPAVQPDFNEANEDMDENRTETQITIDVEETADDSYTYETQEDNSDARDEEESVEDTRVKTDLSDPAQVADILAAMNDSRPSTPPTVVMNDSRSSTPPPVEMNDSRSSTPPPVVMDSDTRCSTPQTAETRYSNTPSDYSDRVSTASVSHGYPIDVNTEEDDDDDNDVPAQNCSSLKKVDVDGTCTTSVPVEQPPPAYSSASTVENGKTGNNDLLDSKSAKRDPKPSVSKKGMPRSYMTLSICACLCNVLIGIIAITFAIKSKDSWRDGKKAKARSNGLNALFCALFGIFSVVAIVSIFLWLEVFTNKSGL